MIRFRYGLAALAFAAALGLVASEAARAAVQDDSGGTRASSAPQGAIVVAERDDRGKNWNKGKNNWNKNWSKNDDWKKYNKNWSKNDDDWKKYNKNWNRNWGHYNNNWNKNWNKRAYVRNWNPRPYYGDFIGGVVLGSILAASGVGVVPYAPAPYLCWYWADPYMYRGYWDYCY
ncbi:MAG TPA: hypothetical protein VHK26_05765 [Methyloceanibacter sp.]|jgi:hypothetical protein|nr:hypothetical protein [Methyloceanibacter sp.]